MTRQRTAPRFSRRTCCVAGGLTIALGVALATSGSVLTAVGATADDSPGSGFANYTLRAGAGGIQFFASTAAGQPRALDGGLPYSEATLNYGPTAHALSSIAWPGSLAANVGSLLLLSGIPSGIPGVSLPVPLPAPPAIPEPLYPYLPLLNSPVRAEAITGGTEEDNNASVPGALMTARVDDRTALSEAQLAPTLNLITGKQRSIRTRSHVALSGPNQAIAEAQNEVLDLELPGGVVKIQSITSYAKVTTDGVKATLDPASKTQVVGATVAGIPVTINEDGVSVQGSPNSVAALTDAVNTALAQSGFQLYIGRAVKTASGGMVNYDAGSLVITMPQDVILEIGGAQAAVAALPAGDYSLPEIPITLPDPSGPTGGDYPGVQGPAVINPDGSITPAPPTNTGQNPAPIVKPASAAMVLPGGLGWGWVAFVLLGAGMMAAGLRRLPDSVMTAGAGACSLTTGAVEPVELDDTYLGEAK